MWKTFEKAAHANVNHYNEHPAQHNAMTLVAGIAAAGVFVGMAYLVNKSEQREIRRRTGRGI